MSRSPRLLSPENDSVRCLTERDRSEPVCGYPVSPAACGMDGASAPALSTKALPRLTLPRNWELVLCGQA